MIEYVNDEIILFSLKWSKEWLDHIKEKMIFSGLIKINDKGISKVGHEIKISDYDNRNLKNIEKLIIGSGKNASDIYEINKNFDLKYSYAKAYCIYCKKNH